MQRLRPDTLLQLALLVLTLLAAGCGGEGDRSMGSPPDGSPRGPEGRPVDPERPPEPQDPAPERDGSPLVLSGEDAATLSYPLLLVDAQGETREVHDAAQMRELLKPDKRPGTSAPVEYVRLFYATDRRREAPGLQTLLAPLLPAAIALAVALLLTRLLLRWLKEEVRKVAYVAGALVLLAAGGLVVRGALLFLETLRLIRETDVLYGSERSVSGGLELGTLIVSIPAQNHRIARIEMPSLLKGELYPDPLKHFVIDEVLPLDPSVFYRDLREDVLASTDHEVLVFVHGYNNTFAYAAMRLAQIVYDVGFDGAPILYSWPSNGAAALYTYDKENADWSAGNLAEFLSMVSSESGADHVHLMAHSMGSRVLSTALMQGVPAAGSREALPFSELILAAPDLDADTFERFIAPALTQRARRVTLYASERDEALMASVQVNGQRRAGMAGEDLIIVPGMDTVDVTRVAGGHAYIADSGRVLGDLVDIVRNRLAADERGTLDPRELDGDRYWEMVER